MRVHPVALLKALMAMPSKPEGARYSHLDREGTVHASDVTGRLVQHIVQTFLDSDYHLVRMHVDLLERADGLLPDDEYGYQYGKYKLSLRVVFLDSNGRNHHVASGIVGHSVQQIFEHVLAKLPEEPGEEGPGES